MGRLDPTYTPEQKQAVAVAMADQSMSAKQAVSAAAAGELGLPAFTMPESTAYDCKRQLRKKRRGYSLTDLARGDLQTGREQLIRRLASLIDQEVEHQATQPKGKRNKRDLDLLMRTAKNLPTGKDPGRVPHRAPLATHPDGDESTGNAVTELLEAAQETTA